MKNLTEPIVSNLIEMSVGTSAHNASPSEQAQVWALYEAMRPLVPQSEGDEYRCLWLEVPRGSADDWLTLDEYRMCEQDPGATEADRLAAWEAAFPEASCWHLLSCGRWQDYLTVGLDGRLVLEVNPNYEDVWGCEGLDEALGLLVQAASAAVGGVRSGTYQRRVAALLPYRHRYGLIERARLWDAVGREHCFEDGKVSLERAQELACALERQGAEEDLGFAPRLTAGAYFAALRSAYRVAGYTLAPTGAWGYPEEDGRAWYCRLGDARDRSLLELDPASEEDFSAWYWTKQGRFDHNFEIFAGGSCSRVYLSPRLDARGWQLHLYGSITWHAADMALVWQTMNEIGIPTYLHDAERVARVLRGLDTVLVVPRHIDPSYVRGNQFGHDVITAMPLWESRERELVSAVDWTDLDMPQLEPGA